MLNYSQGPRFLFVTVLIASTLGCATTDSGSMIAVDQLRPPKELAEKVPESKDFAESLSQTKVIEGQSSDYQATYMRTDDASELPPLPDQSFRGSYNNMTVAAFINEIFGNQLGLSFVIDARVQGMDELVSLRLVDEVDGERLYSVARETLANYGVAMTSRAGLYSFSLSEEATGGDLPLVVTGRALPDVPPSHRPLFVYVPVKVVDSNTLRSWLTWAMRGQDLEVQAIREMNAILLQGKESVIGQALEIIELLDQPANRGSFSAIVEPVYTESKQLANDLELVLDSQGYDASNRPPAGTIMVLDMRSANQIVLLASTKEVLEHAVSWAEKLDRQTTVDIRDGVFSYQARNTDVEYMVGLLDQLKSQRGGKNGTRDRFIADVNRNAVVYRGAGKDWVELLPAIQAMDVPTPSVLVEVILAEVTLNDQDETGFEFLARSGDVTFSTIGGLGIGGSGLTATLNRAGETRAVLNAFYKSERANIRSRPRLMVKSGQKARIDVGNEIPFVTSTSQSTENPDAPVIQTVNYRKTGVILQIEPVVHSSGYVDIRIQQELSEAQQTSTSSIDSPTVFNRKLETTVTLRDGGSVLLGGLISESNSDSDNGIKGLGRIPGVGRLFRTDSQTTDRTELVMMVVPYVIDNPDEAAEITDRALEFLELTR